MHTILRIAVFFGWLMFPHVAQARLEVQEVPWPLAGSMSISQELLLRSLAPRAQAADECIARRVSATFSKEPGVNVSDLITDAFRFCWLQVDALFSAYRAYFGEGSEDAYFVEYFSQVIGRVRAWFFSHRHRTH